MLEKQDMIHGSSSDADLPKKGGRSIRSTDSVLDGTSCFHVIPGRGTSHSSRLRLRSDCEVSRNILSGRQKRWEAMKVDWIGLV